MKLTAYTCDRCGHAVEEIGCPVCEARELIEVVAEKSVRGARRAGQLNRIVAMIPVDLWFAGRLSNYAVVHVDGERIECFQTLDERITLGVMP